VKFFGFRDPISKHIFQSLWSQQAHLIPDLGYLTQKHRVKREKTILIQRKGRIPPSYKKITPNGHNKITEQIFQKLLNEPKTRILEWNNFQNAIKEISQARGIICESLHAGIIATTQHTPFSIIQYQEKIQNYIRDVTKEIYNAIDENNLEDLKIIELRYPPIKKENYTYGRVYGKLYRRIYHFLENFWI
jgi:polysaccharide pyruvyl transferase WcaK-like protein